MTIFIALFALFFTYVQVRIASSNLRMQLYKKRFNIYSSALELYQELYSNPNILDKNEIKNKARKFNVCYMEATFLFPKNDPVNKTLEQMNSSADLIVGYLVTNRVVDSEELKNCKKKYLEGMKRLAVQIRRYIEIDSLSGWKFF